MWVVKSVIMDIQLLLNNECLVWDQDPIKTSIYVLIEYNSPFSSYSFFNSPWKVIDFFRLKDLSPKSDFEVIHVTLQQRFFSEIA